MKRSIFQEKIILYNLSIKSMWISNHLINRNYSGLVFLFDRRDVNKKKKEFFPEGGYTHSQVSPPFGYKRGTREQQRRANSLYFVFQYLE